MTCEVCGRQYQRADAYDGDLCPWGCVPPDEDAYKVSDPKHPRYLEFADMLRDREREGK